MPVSVKLRVTRGVRHAQQVLAGFLLLHRSREIKLEVTLLKHDRSPQPFLIRAEIDGVPVLYDVQDGILFPNSPVNVSLIEGTQYLFARAYRPGSYGAFEDRVLPLGLNYVVTIRHPVAFRANWRGPKDLAISVIKRAAGGQGEFSLDVRTFESPPTDRADGPVVFLNRHWEPPDSSDEKFASDSQLNLMRIATVRALRAELGDRFIGGLAPTPYAVARYPDVVAPASLVAQRRYLALARTAAVCVTTTGLAGSNGWKLAEYVASSSAIVTEGLAHEVPGSFRDGANYLSFDTGRVRIPSASPSRRAGVGVGDG